MLGQQIGRPIGRQRASEEPALAQLATKLAQPDLDRAALHPLGGDRKPQALAESDDRLDELPALRLLVQALHEAAIDLDPVEGQSAQMRERRITGAEIVEGKAYALILQADDDRSRDFEILEERALRDLELEALRRKPGLGQQLDELLREPGIGELARGDVDRELEIRIPLRRVVKGKPHQRFGERSDQS